MVQDNRTFGNEERRFGTMILYHTASGNYGKNYVHSEIKTKYAFLIKWISSKSTKPHKSYEHKTIFTPCRLSKTEQVHFLKPSTMHVTVS